MERCRRTGGVKERTQRREMEGESDEKNQEEYERLQNGEGQKEGRKDSEDGEGGRWVERY